MTQRFPKIISSAHGCHIDGSLLWFDELQAPEVCLLSHHPLRRLPSWGAKLVTSDDLATILSATSQTFLRHSPVRCPFGYPFSLGAYELEWLPAGLTLGTASIRVQAGGWSLLYAPHSMPTTALLTAKTVLKPSDVLIVAALSPDPHFKPLARDEILAELVTYCLDFHRQHRFYPIIVCDVFGCAQELISYFGLHGLKLGLSAEIYKYAKLYRDAQIDLGSTWSAFRRKYFRDKVLLVSARHLNQIVLSPAFRRSLVCVTGYLHLYQQYQQQGHYDRTYYLSYQNTLEDIQLTLAAVKPKQVVLIGPYIRAYTEFFAAYDGEVVLSYPNQQPSLFDLSP